MVATNCDREGCVWSLFQGEVQVLGMLSEMFRHPRGRVMESDRHPGLELRKEMWAGLGAWRSCKCLAVVARTGCFHVTVKPASWLLRSPYAARPRAPCGGGTWLSSRRHVSLCWVLALELRRAVVACTQRQLSELQKAWDTQKLDSVVLTPDYGSRSLGTRMWRSGTWNRAA